MKIMDKNTEIKDKKELVKLISFLAMCDGSLHSNGGSKNCVFSFSQKEGHEDFVTWVKGVVENITSCKLYRNERKESEVNRNPIIKIQTLSHPFFSTLRDRIYVGNYKSIDPHALKLIDWQCLAIMYMCDGCLSKYDRESKSEVVKSNYTTTLNLCRLSYGDQLLLKKTLKEKFDLEWNVVKTAGKYYALKLRLKDFDRFMNGIAPYMFDSYLYKLDLRTTNPPQ